MRWKDMRARPRGDAVVIDLAGQMCLCGEEELPACVSDLLEQGFRKFVLNLAQVPLIDSAGLGGMVLAYTAVTRRGGRLVLLHVSRRIRRLLETTKLAAIFEVYDTEDEAVRSLGSPFPSAI